MGPGSVIARFPLRCGRRRCGHHSGHRLTQRRQRVRVAAHRAAGHAARHGQRHHLAHQAEHRRQLRRQIRVVGERRQMLFPQIEILASQRGVVRRFGHGDGL
jgi:hypothetical protein